MNAIIEFKNVNQVYQFGNHILKTMDNVNFTVNEDELLVILGLSGAGKSTLPNLFGGIDSVTSGQIETIVINENPKNGADLEWWVYACKKDDTGNIE